VVVVGPRREHDIRVPLTYAPDDLLADVERGQKLAIVVIEHFVGDAETPAGFLSFGAAAFGERAAAFDLVAGVAVGDRHKFHSGAERAEPGGRAGGPDVAIVGMRPESNNTQWMILRRQPGGENQQKDAEPEHVRHPRIHPSRPLRASRRAPCGPGSQTGC
jgi:hypothetical protein